MIHKDFSPLRATLFYTTALYHEKEATVHSECDIERTDKERETLLHNAPRACDEKQDHTVTCPLDWSTQD